MRHLSWLALSLAGLLAGRAEAAPLRACATIPDLGAIVRAVGGDDAAVVVFAKGTEDPHFVEAKPSFIKQLAGADLLVVSGLDLEAGWLPPLLDGARNSAVLPGSAGYLDASTAIVPLDRPAGVVDRSMGDVHPFGNPHYLLDPVNGLRVAALVRDRLTALRPEARESFAAHYQAFRRRVGAALVGEALAAKYDVEKLAVLGERGELDRFLESQGDAAQLGGWLGRLRPARGAKAVDDHPIWAYFARRFGIAVVGHMEPKPGIPPTTRHLGDLAARMKREEVRLILASAYYDPRHARFLSAETGARIANLANQVGARPGTDDYVAMIDYDVGQVLSALGVS
jgi:ABC-type Zn uptake system ZnuABC Zn-binding protein ZnuA